ncbi:hypothetical protein JTB14_008190 [Gonioctena quinquepunctata]|nr:hypothetical protein JTB14_008190 [Gonioctena quinquepunctata]
MVYPIISKRHITHGICSQQRLALTLHYLSQGGTKLNLAWAYQMGATTVHKIIHETCIAIRDVLSPICLKTPSSEEDWINIANGFFEQWNLVQWMGNIFQFSVLRIVVPYITII